MLRVITNSGCRRLAHRLVTTKTIRSLSIRPIQVRPKLLTTPRSTSTLAIRYQSSNDSSGGQVEKIPARDRIHNMIHNSDKKIFLFMKGVPESPQCGFSKAVVQILDAYEVEFDSCDVLEDPEIRQEIKAYSNWPTIPQLYVNGSFVGGCDILIQMHQNDELDKLFESAKAQPEPELVKEEELPVSRLVTNDLVKEEPIKSLDLVKNIDKVSKKGSLTVDLFKGKFDDDFLTYPEPLKDRVQNQQLKDQAAMIRQLYPKIWDDDRQLQKYNFFNMYQLSVTEMMTLFESIGASSRDCSRMSKSPMNTADGSQTIPYQTQISKAMIDLVIRNCLTYWPMANAESEKIKSLMPQKHIIFGGSVDMNTPYKPIGFCWTETVPELGSLPPQEWQTIGERGGPDTLHHLIKGKKTRVLYDESVENYLVYYKDKFLSEKYEKKLPDDEPNPASDPFIGCSLVHKSHLNFGPVYYDSAGCQYADVDINAVVAEDQTIFAAKRLDPTGVNIKALGQLATCSIVMGMLKDSLKMTYQHLLRSKKGLLECDIIQRKMSTVTSRIYALESMIYYIAGMYDGLEEGFDAHMEATILKVVTNEFAYFCLKELQDVCSSDMFIISKLQDQVNIFDAFLDGNIYNRLYLATMGIIWYARSKNMHLNQLRLSPWYPGYLIKSLIRERAERGDLLTLNADIYGSMHPALYEAGIELEYILKRIKHAAESIVMRHGKDVTNAQSSLYKLAQLSMDAFMLTTMCARASKSYSNGSRNCELDLNITTTYARELACNCRLLIEEVDKMPINYIATRCADINELNIKAGGYYAESPLDPNI